MVLRNLHITCSININDNSHIIRIFNCFEIFSENNQNNIFMTSYIKDSTIKNLVIYNVSPHFIFYDPLRFKVEITFVNVILNPLKYYVMAKCTMT